MGQRRHGKSRSLYFLQKETKMIIANRISFTHRIVPAVKRVEFVTDRGVIYSSQRSLV